MNEPSLGVQGQPRHIGPYEIRETIGRGGMAAVYKGYQPSLDRVVALKVISAHLAAEPEFMERFRQEARAIARLSHPNILIVHDFGEAGGVPYLVMEYVDGHTLADFIPSGIPREQAAVLVDQVAAGLDYAHSRGIVHRDIKPQNVLVTREGRAVLADFGLARMMEGTHRLTLAGGVVGTPEYMSPEQAAGRATDHRTDVYALGVILYELLSGTRPFTAETPLGVLMKHLQEPPAPIRQVRPDISPAIEAVITRALAKSPDERYQTAGELAAAFRTALASGGAPAVPPAAASPSVGTPPHPPVPAPPPDLSKYAGLRREAERATRPHETPSMARLRTPHHQQQAAVPHASTPPVPEADVRPTPCPECGTLIPPGDSMCPNCLYMLPFEQVAARPPKREVERSEVRVNLLPYGLRWDPSGLERARALAQQKAAELAAQGWELTSPLDAAGTFVQGRSASGAVVMQAILHLQRVV